MNAEPDLDLARADIARAFESGAALAMRAVWRPRLGPLERVGTYDLTDARPPSKTSSDWASLRWTFTR